MKTACPPLTLVLLLFTIALNAAETAFVVDKLLVGVHLEEDLNSAIVKVLPTGSKLEVLARKGETARIKDAAGVGKSFLLCGTRCCETRMSRNPKES